MDDIFRILREKADFVLVDTPPALYTDDVLAVARRSDGILMVLDEQRASGEAMLELRRQFEPSRVPVVGGIVNNRAGEEPEQAEEAEPVTPSISP
jgi:Mrp family chromosome partitioning ATPase